MVFHILIIGYFFLYCYFINIVFLTYYHRSRFCDSIQYLFDRIVQIQFSATSDLLLFIIINSYVIVSGQLFEYSAKALCF